MLKHTTPTLKSDTTPSKRDPLTSNSKITSSAAPSSDSKLSQRYSAPTAVKTFSPTRTKTKSRVVSKQGVRPVNHSTPIKPKVVSHRRQGRAPELLVSRGPKPIIPKSLKLQQSNEKVIKPMKFAENVMKPEFKLKGDSENDDFPRTCTNNNLEFGADDDSFSEIHTPENDVIIDDASFTSDISSILSFDSAGMLSPLNAFPDAIVNTAKQPHSSKSNISKSKSCSNVSVLPSERIQGFMRESKYLYARSPRRLNSANSKPPANLKPPDCEPSPGVRHSKSGLRGPVPPVTTRYPLRKSRSTQHTNSTNSTGNSSQVARKPSEALSPHLKYGIFNGSVSATEGRRAGGVKKSSSTVSYTGLRKCGSLLSVDSMCSENESELSVTCQKLQRQNENLQKCLTVSQDRAIRKISQLKDTTHSIVDERRELVSSMEEKDERITNLREQLHSISVMGSGFSDTESIMSEASEYNDALTENLRRRNAKLKDKIRRFEEVLAKCKTTIQNGIEATNSLTKEKEELHQRLERLEFEREEEKSGAGEVTSSSEILIQINERGGTPANSAAEVANQRISDLKGEVDRYKEEENSRSLEIYQLVTEIERVKQDNIRLSAEVDVGSTKVQTLTSELSEVKRQLLEREKKAEQLSSDINVKENSLLSQIEEYKSEISSLQNTLDKLAAETERLKRDLHDRDVNKAMELQDVRTEHAGQVTLLNNKISALKQELHGANRTLSVLKDRDSSLEDLLEEMSGIRGELERVSEENTGLREDVEVKEEELERLQTRQRQELATQSTEQETLLKSWQEKYEGERSEKEEKERTRRDKEEELQQEVRGLTADCERLATELNLVAEERTKERSEWEYKFRQLDDSKIGERERLEETHRSQLTPFKTKIKEMQTQITKLQEEKEEQDQEISDLTRHVFESNSDCALLNNEVTELLGKLQSAENSVLLLQEQTKTKTTECVDLADTISTASDNLKASQLTATELQKQLDQLINDKAELEAEVETLRNDLRELGSQNKDFEQLICDLRRKMKNSDEEHQMKCSQLQEAINSVMTDRDNTVRQCGDLTARYSDLEHTLTSRTDGTEVLSEQNRLLQERLNELQGTVKELQEELGTAESTNKQLSQEEERLRGTLTELEGEHSKRTEQLNSHISELKLALEHLENEKSNTGSQIESLIQERDTILLESGENSKRFGEHRKSLEQLLEQVKKDLTAKDEELKKSRTENQEHKELVEKLERQVEELEGSRKESWNLASKIKELETDIEIKSKSISKLEADLINKAADFNSRIAALHNDLESSQTTCELLRKQCTKSEEEVEALETRKEEEVKRLELRREEDLKMYAAQHQDEVKKQEELEALCVKLKEEMSGVERKLHTEVANHQKAKEGLGKASQAIGKLRGYVKEQENKIENLTKLKDKLEAKNKDTMESHNNSLSEVQHSYMQKLEHSAETENRLKLELKAGAAERAGLAEEKEDMESRVRELVEEKKQLKEIMKEKIEENRRLHEEVETNKKEEADNESETAEKDARLGQLNNDIKHLENELENCRSTENEIRSILEEHVSVKGDVPNNDNKMVDVSLPSQIKDVIFSLNSQISDKQTELKTTIDQRNQFKVKLVELKKKAEVKIAELSEDKRSTEKQVLESNEQLSELKEELLQKENAVVELTSKFDESKKRHSSLMSELETTKNELSSAFQSEKLAISTELNNITSELHSKEKEVLSLSRSLSLSKKEVLSLSEQLEQSTIRLREEAAKAESLKSDLEVTLTSSSDTNSQITFLQNKLLETQNNVEQITSVGDEIKQKYIQLEETYSEGCVKVSNLESLLTEVNMEKNSISQELEASKETIEQKVLEMSTLSSKLEELGQQLANESDEKAKLQNEMAHLQTAERENLDNVKTELRNIIEELEQEKASLFAESDVLRSEAEKLQNTIIEFEKKTESFRNERETLESERETLREELATVRSYLEKQENLQSISQESEEKLTNELESVSRSLEEKENLVPQLEAQINSLKSELSRHAAEREYLSEHSTELSNKIRDLETSLTSREDDLKTLQQDNTRLSSHAKNLDVCFASLKEEKNKIVESMSQMMADREAVERSHKVELLKTKTRLEQEHTANMEQLNQAMQHKIQKVSQEENLVAKLQSQLKKSESSLSGAREEAERAQAKCSVTVSEYSSKLLQTEKKCSALREQLTEQSDTARSRDQELSKLKADNITKIDTLKRDTIPKTEHDEIVFNLEMAYNMNMQETTDRLECRIKELEGHLGGDGLPSSNRQSPEEVSDLKRHVDSLTRRHKVEIETIRNESIFTANQEYELKLKQWQEANEQRNLEDINKILEESSRERQRLLREMEVLRSQTNRQTSDKQTDKLTSAFNTSAGRISISSEYSDAYLLDAEYEYLKEILYKYFKGEHTEQSLKVILAILRYSEAEKGEILRTAR